MIYYHILSNSISLKGSSHHLFLDDIGKHPFLRTLLIDITYVLLCSYTSRKVL